MFENDLKTLFTTVIPFRIDELIIIRFCPIVLPDSLGRSCYLVENLYVIEIIVLKPVNNFLFGSSNFSYYRWNGLSYSFKFFSKLVNYLFNG